MNEEPLLPARERVTEAIRVAAAVVLFAALYLGAFVALGGSAVAAGMRGAVFWAGLLAAAFATWLTVRIVEQGRWSIGFFVPPRLALIEGALGLGLAVAVIGVADGLIEVSTSIHHTAGGGFPWRELAIGFLPAAIHEEIVFRGYVFQRLRVWNRPLAIVVTSICFSALHGGNRGINAIAYANLAIAGVLLALAYERYERLWFPIGLHLTWNLLSGPILGYEVSGYRANATVLRTVGSAPTWASGGEFGIEGSAWMIPVELVAIAALAIANRRRALRSTGGEAPRG